MRFTYKLTASLKLFAFAIKGSLAGLIPSRDAGSHKGYRVGFLKPATFRKE